MIHFLKSAFQKNKTSPALVWENTIYTYGEILSLLSEYTIELEKYNIQPGMTVELHGDFSPHAIAMLIALTARCCIIIPTTKSVNNNRAHFQNIAEIQHIIEFDESDQYTHKTLPHKVKHALYHKLIQQNSPGLVLFSSGSTGAPKAALHDFGALLKKFATPRPAKRMVNFLLFDHIGGINTLFYNLANGGCLISLNNRSPRAVCQAIAAYKVQVLPTTPSFINLLLVSGVCDQYDLSNLELITYGTEPMPESTLLRFHQKFPHIRLSQTYGLSEVGILRAKSKSSNSLLIKIGGEGYQTRVVNGLLEIKADSAMLGYLNADSPFTEDGWFKTGDVVIEEGEYLQILGRQSEIINVGGEKAYPVEIENVIHRMENVTDVVVSGEKHPIMGQIVKACVTLSEPEEATIFRKRLREFCKQHLSVHKVPQKIIISDEPFHNERFKRIRKDKQTKTE